MEAWFCPWEGSCRQSAFLGRGGGRGVGPVPVPPASAGAQRVVTEAWGSQLSGTWRHRGCAWGATFRLEKSPGFHPEN